MSALEMKCTEDAQLLAQELNDEKRQHLWNHYEMIRQGLHWQIDRLKEQSPLMHAPARLQRWDELQRIAVRAQYMREACEFYDRRMQ